MRVFQKDKTPLPQRGAGLPLRSLKGPFEADIGCGAGLSAWLRARQKPLSQIIAFEKTRTRFQQFQKRLRQDGRPKNLWPLHTNAVWWLSHYGYEGMLDKISLFYPNPYPKSRQANLRWINRPFMAFLIRLLHPQRGVLELRANSRGYIAEFKAGLARFPGLYAQSEQAISLQAKPQSDFEKKYLARGEPCFSLTAAQKGAVCRPKA